MRTEFGEKIPRFHTRLTRITFWEMWVINPFSPRCDQALLLSNFLDTNFVFLFFFERLSTAIKLHSSLYSSNAGYLDYFVSIYMLSYFNNNLRLMKLTFWQILLRLSLFILPARTFFVNILLVKEETLVKWAFIYRAFQLYVITNAYVITDAESDGP